MMNKNEQDLNNLFNKAKNEPERFSFEETKNQFIQSSNATIAAKNGRIGKIINLKSIIMFTLISAISLTAVIFTTTPTESKPNKTALVVVNELLIDSSDVVKETEKVIEEFYEQEMLTKTFLEPHELDNREEEKVILKILTREKIVKQTKAQARSVLAIFADPFRFPKLTEKEISDNHKQKVKMVKKLAKFNDKHYSYIPSNTYKGISIQAFYMQRTEVSNLEYRTFLFDLIIQNRKEDFLTAQPDQKMWRKEYPTTYNEPMVLNYFSHPAYNDYPVVTISRAGAELYCKWLTIEAVKLFPKKTSKLNDVRIPTDSEWMMAASGNIESNNFPWEGNSSRNEDGCYLANFNPEAGAGDDGGFHTVAVNSYLSNPFGLFCMSGNVAEMIYYSNGTRINPGTKGGSWTSTEKELWVNGVDRWKGRADPSVNIGFRPVITYTESAYSK
tara:strand:- start:576 stop:1907 length:1332 start_codon:yes stop_codon:yes gene_type:complete